jgi:hypothetical protein
MSPDVKATHPEDIFGWRQQNDGAHAIAQLVANAAWAGRISSRAGR